jgi:serine/threonine protein kinase
MYAAPELLKKEEGEEFLFFLLLLLFVFIFRIEYRFEYDIWSLAMILFELMELEYPYDGTDYQIIKRAMEGKVKPLKTERSPELVQLYNSMRNMVYVFLFIYYLLFIFVRMEAFVHVL